MKKILTYGTFDLLHYGHIRLLERAKKLGDYLVVAVSTDEFNEIKVKYKACAIKYFYLVTKCHLSGGFYCFLNFFYALKKKTIL